MQALLKQMFGKLDRYVVKRIRILKKRSSVSKNRIELNVIGMIEMMVVFYFERSRKVGPQQIGKDIIAQRRNVFRKKARLFPRLVANAMNNHLIDAGLL
jgi:hypothetical protein